VLTPPAGNPVVARRTHHQAYCATLDSASSLPCWYQQASLPWRQSTGRLPDAYQPIAYPAARRGKFTSSSLLPSAYTAELPQSLPGAPSASTNADCRLLH
jgi:hypothetical protein